MRPVATIGSLGVPHCSPYSIATGSPNVFVNGKPVATLGSISTPHLFPARRCPPHTAIVSSGSTSVFVNGKPMARVGDRLAACTFIASGSTNVFVR